MSSPYSVLVLGLTLAACDHPKEPSPAADARSGGGAAASDRMLEVPPTAAPTPLAEEPRHLVAALQGTDAHPDLQGTVHLVRTPGGVEIAGEIRGLPPGPHGWHVHLSGDCTDPANGSAGPHLDFAAIGEPGDPTPTHIAGDLGNLVGNEHGAASPGGTVEGLEGKDLEHLVGRAVIVHEKPNDPAHPPDGAAGTPIACGVLGVAPPVDEVEEATGMAAPGAGDDLTRPQRPAPRPPQPNPEPTPRPIPGR